MVQTLHPVTMAMKKSVPARLPKKEVIQTMVKLMSEDRRCRTAVNMNYESSKTVRSEGTNRATHHDIAGEEVGTAKDYHNEPNRKEYGRDRPNETRCIFLVPRCCIRGQQYRAAVAMVRTAVRYRLIRALDCKMLCEYGASEVEILDSPEAQQRASHEGVPEQFVPSHMRLFASYPRDQFDGLLRGEGVHGLGSKESLSNEY